MAFPQWRRDKKKVYVYYVDPATGKQVQLPRKLTAHLDGRPPDAVFAWVEQWERDHGRPRARAERTILKDGDLLDGLWKQYQKGRRSSSPRRPRTERNETDFFLKHIVPFFVATHQKKDPATWHSLVPEFHVHIYDKKSEKTGKAFSDSQIKGILWTLERFGDHLVFHGHMTFPFKVQTPARQDHKVTPLKVRKEPEEVLTFVKEFDPSYKKINFKLMALLGYFAALRPSELFALEKSDLLTGKDAEANTDTLPGFRTAGLGSRLSVSVTKTLPDAEGAEPVELTKTDTSCAVVNIWHVEAAKLLAALVKDLPDGRLFPYSYSWLQKTWGKFVEDQGGFGITLHDLRRASALYLGRTLRIPVTLLQEHMRHAEIDTTMLYIREPNKAASRKKHKQDFDDVA
jgi:integrase